MQSARAFVSWEQILHLGVSHTTIWQQPWEKLTGSFYTLQGQLHVQLGHLQQTWLAKQAMNTLVWIWLVVAPLDISGQSWTCIKKGGGYLQDLPFSDSGSSLPILFSDIIDHSCWICRHILQSYGGSLHRDRKVRLSFKILKWTGWIWEDTFLLYMWIKEWFISWLL